MEAWRQAAEAGSVRWLRRFAEQRRLPTEGWLHLLRVDPDAARLPAGWEMRGALPAASRAARARLLELAFEQAPEVPGAVGRLAELAGWWLVGEELERLRARLAERSGKSNQISRG